jgi:hypothetical protein
MAVNVYLVFFKRYDARHLKRLYWIYAVLCYGIPFIPAMVCLLLKPKKGVIYGNATVILSFILSVKIASLHSLALVLDR